MGKGGTRPALLHPEDTPVEVGPPVRATHGVQQRRASVVAFPAVGSEALLVGHCHHSLLLSACLSLQITRAGVDDAVTSTYGIHFFGTDLVAASRPSPLHRAKEEKRQNQETLHDGSLSALASKSPRNRSSYRR